MKLYLIALTLFVCFNVSGQIESPFTNGATLLGMGNAGVSEQGEYTLFYNQAGIANLSQWSASFNAARLYNDSGLLHLHGGVIFPTNELGVFGIRISSFGTDGYNFQNYSFTYARKLFSNFSLSTSLNLYQFRIENYGNAIVPNIELGFLTQISEKLSLGAHIANPFPISISERSELPTIFNGGIRYEISSLVSLNADVEKNINEKENIKLGLSYQIHPLVVLRGGFNTFPSSLYFGFGIMWKDIEINFGNGYHQILGNSTGVNFVYHNEKA